MIVHHGAAALALARFGPTRPCVAGLARKPGRGGLACAGDPARHSGVTDREVRYSLADLVALGEIEAVGRARRGAVTWRLRFLSGTPVPDKAGLSGMLVPDKDGLIRNAFRSPRNACSDEPHYPSSSSSCPKISDDKLSEAVALWNDLASEVGLGKCSRLTEKRRTQLAARLDEAGLEGWRQALANIRSTPGLRGANAKGFKANLDWLSGEDAFHQVLEGRYAGWDRPAGNGGNGVDAEDRARREDAKAAFRYLGEHGIDDLERLTLVESGMSLQAAKAYVRADANAAFDFLGKHGVGDAERIRLVKAGMSLQAAKAYVAERQGCEG